MKRRIVYIFLVISGMLMGYYYYSVQTAPVLDEADKKVEANKNDDLIELEDIEAEVALQEDEAIREEGVKEAEMSPEQEKLEVQIVEKYTAELLALQGEYNGKVDALVSEAKIEYKKLPKAKRNEAKLTLGLKYLQKGSALEAECDSRVEAILMRLQAELSENNLPLNAVENLKTAYESQKNERRGKLLNQE